MALSINDLLAQTWVPVATFLFALLSSVHCVGMCGGLVAASCSSSEGQIFYQIGRLLSYFLLTGFIVFIGQFIVWDFLQNIALLIGSFSIGLLFVFWGMEKIWGVKISLNFKFLNQSTYLWRRAFQLNREYLRSFMIGSLSLFLPCGLLYGVLISLVALSSPMQAFLGVLGFWLGTLPAMLLAPQFFRKLSQRWLSQNPKILGSFVMGLGIFTIIYRIVLISQGVSCH